MPDPLMIQVYSAVGTLARAPIKDHVPADRVYQRSIGMYSPERDKAPSLLVYQSPTQPVAQRKLLSGKRDITWPIIVALVDSTDGNPSLGSQKVSAADMHWRTSWRTDFLAAIHGLPVSMPTGVCRVVPSDEPLIDGMLFEAKGLWWSAVPIQVRWRG